MGIGMLWIDTEPKAELSSKVERAIVYYRSKYGATPTVCFVNPSMIAAAAKLSPEDNPTLQMAGVEIRSSQSVQHNHLWFGIEWE
jgi:hypothetical protein